MGNPIREKIGQDAPAWGFGICFPAPGILECAAHEWDWTWIDVQHGQFGYQDTLACVRTADYVNVPALIRMPSHEYGEIGRAADMNPAGLVIPMVDTADEARAVVDAMRFPPLGRRSYGGRRVGDLLGMDYYKHANQDKLLVVQIESPEGIANAEEIIAVDGVDCLFFGPFDVKMRLGMPITAPVEESQELDDAMKGVAEFARKAGKFSGCVATSVEAASRAVALGYRLIVGMSDVGCLRGSAPKHLKNLQGISG